MSTFADLWSHLMTQLGYKTEMRLLMVGLDGAGKTTILYKLMLGQVVTTVPTIGFNVETVAYKNIEFTVWDMGGQDSVRVLWKRYYENTDGLIFVVDSNDTSRLDLARGELDKLVKDEHISTCPILVFANKQDLPHAMNPAKVRDKMGQTGSRANVHVMPCQGTTGVGVYEGLEWLSTQIAAKRPSS